MPLGETPKPRPTSTERYGKRKKNMKRPTSAEARASGSNMAKRPKKTGTNRVVGSTIMTVTPKGAY